MSRLVLGLNSHHGDAAAFLAGPSGPIAGIAEERLNRQKHSGAFPAQAVREVLKIAGASIADVTDIAVARDRSANLAVKAGYLLRNSEGWGEVWKNLKVHSDVASVRERLADALGVDRSAVRAELHFVEHHLAHAASAFFWSPFDRCTGLTMDGAGDFVTCMITKCEGNRIDIVRKVFWPHSVGVFYTAMCQFIGFDRYGEEYKVMGLAAYGHPRFLPEMREILLSRPGGEFRLDLDFFRHHRMAGEFETIEDGEVKLPILFSDKLGTRFGPPRKRGEPIAERERDLAASTQVRYEEVFLSAVEAAVSKVGYRDIILAGGCALNSVANGRMISEGYVDRAYFQPAASDDGTAAGAAAWVLYGKHHTPRTPGVWNAYWGPEWEEGRIESALHRSARAWKRLEKCDLVRTAAEALAEGKVVGWFQGREEWGPRALGNRSILCNPAVPGMKEILNARVKHREPFRPFAPAIREEDLDTCFEGTHPVPFMIVVYRVKPDWKERLQAITHEDGTARVQTVSHKDNPLFHELIGAFKATTGIPAVLNTSFNENEPIVHDPAEAIDCFMRTRMDCLGIGPFWLSKDGNQ